MQSTGYQHGSVTHVSLWCVLIPDCSPTFPFPTSSWFPFFLQLTPTSALLGADTHLPQDLSLPSHASLASFMHETHTCVLLSSEIMSDPTYEAS